MNMWLIYVWHQTVNKNSHASSDYKYTQKTWTMKGNQKVKSNNKKKEPYLE